MVSELKSNIKLREMTSISMMAGESGGDGSDVTYDASLPTFIIVPTANHHYDYSFSVEIITFKLNGHNFIIVPFKC